MICLLRAVLTHIHLPLYVWLKNADSSCSVNYTNGGFIWVDFLSALNCCVNFETTAGIADNAHSSPHHPPLHPLYSWLFPLY